MDGRLEFMLQPGRAPAAIISSTVSASFMLWTLLLIDRLHAVHDLHPDAVASQCQGWMLPVL
jgi:hypothetical protein